MLIAGFDPGSRVFGIGIVRKDNNEFSYVHSEEIKFPESKFHIKMELLISELERIFRDFDPDETAMEEGFMGKNVSSMNILAKVRGVVLGETIRKKKSLKFYSPKEVKISVTGSGNASKDQVNKMIRYILNIRERELGNDESDALAVAYCHASSSVSFLRKK